MFLNTFTQSVTRNWFDESDRRYYHRIVDNLLERRIEENEWVPVDRRINFWPENRSNERGSITSVKKIASDNNRLLILTEDNTLYWRCMINDAASWVITFIEIAEYIGAADQSVFELIDMFFPPEAERDSDVMRGLIWQLIEKYDSNLRTLEDQSYDSLQAWAAAYKDWVIRKHNPDLGWNSLFHRKWQIDEENNIDSREFFEIHRIIDIAVGNWSGTVITYYVLTEPLDRSERPKIWFIDEEPIMGRWKAVPNQSELFLPVQGYNKLCASHSVIAVVSHGIDQPAKIQWLRYDAHSNDQFPAWPMNWTEVWSLETPKAPDFIEDQFSGTAPYDMGEHNELVQEFPLLSIYDQANYPGWHKVEAPTKIVSEFFD